MARKILAAPARHPEKSKRPTGRTLAHPTQVDLFAREFESEDYLRKVVADLFRKMGHVGVRITHGANEKGKDIVFYSNGPLGEMRLFACVIKNAPITGQADDHNCGAPTIVAQIAPGVLNQIHSAFAEPLSSPKGADEWVDSVYVISPYDCSPAAIDAVKHTLQRSGQISFMCGQRLLELFLIHWREFLWFESTVLLSYLSALRKDAEADYALASLILQKSGYLQASSTSLLDLYVEPTFYRELRSLRLRGETLIQLHLLGGPRYLSEIEDQAKAARRINLLLHVAATGTNKGPQEPQGDLLCVAGEMLELWNAQYRKQIAQLRASATNSASHGHGFAASGAFQASAFVPPSEREIAVELNPLPTLVEKVNTVSAAVRTAIDELRAESESATRFALARTADPLLALASPDFLTYCKISDIARILPEAFAAGESNQRLSYAEDLLDHFPSSLLITGPAGYGKTTFCRWHAIRDANRLVSKEALVLPVYRPLHPLSNGELGTFEETFFANAELKKLIQQQAAGQSPFTHIRLYLDGLDEITSHERQNDILTIAAQAIQKWKFLQVILTARDHVSGQGLRWFPRIRLCELDETKIRKLAEGWLGGDRLHGFFERLNEVGTLADLMRVPLLATLILAVYRKTGAVPPNKTNLYGLFVELLCGGWDFYKNIQRRPSRFSTRDKEVALARLAGILQHESKRDATDADFRAALRRSLNFLSPDWDQFLHEIIEDGLLIRAGTTLTFAHLSFQEFLAARDLRDHAGNRPKQALAWYLNGKDWWKEVLAFYVTLSDRPGDTDEWLIERALKSSTTAPDLKERVGFLRKAIQAAFPAYKETSPCRSLFDKLRR